MPGSSPRPACGERDRVRGPRAAGLVARWTRPARGFADVEDAALERLEHGLALVVAAELHEQVCDVQAHGALADRQLARDVVVRHALGHEPEDLALARAQLRPPHALDEPRRDLGRHRGVTRMHGPDAVDQLLAL